MQYFLEFNVNNIELTQELANLLGHSFETNKLLFQSHIIPLKDVNQLCQHQSVQFSHSVMSNFATPWTAACQASLSITNSQSLLKLMSIESLMPSNHLILSHFLLLPPSVFPSIRIFSKESVLHIRWPKYWSFSFSIIPSKEHPGLISFRMDWLDLLAVQGTLKSLLHVTREKSLKYSFQLLGKKLWW